MDGKRKRGIDIMGQLVDIKLNKKLFENVDESALTSTFAALENCFVTESDGLSRFPKLIDFVDLGGNAEVYLSHIRGDLIAACADGRIFRIDQNGSVSSIEGTPVLGGLRTSFAKTRSSMIMAAGAQVVKFNGAKNEILNDAPISSFVGYVDGYILAVEKHSGRFQHSDLNSETAWNPLNTFAVDGRPDNINAMLITPFNEIILTGEESIEQFERYIGGDSAFFRRWSIGDGIIEPYTLCHVDNAAWGLNNRFEFVRISGQTSTSASDDIQKDLEHKYSMKNLGSFNKAWAAPLFIKGQKFIVLQSQEATNFYGTKGFTGVFDVRRNQWFEINGWDSVIGAPTLWQGRSIYQIWGKTYVGGEGKIYELTDSQTAQSNFVQRAYIRTAHYDDLGTIRIDRVRFTLKRGVGTYDKNPKLMFRSNPDNRGFNMTQFRNLGYTGQGDMIIEYGLQGIGTTWQFEILCTDDCPLEIRRMQVETTQVNR